MGNVDQPIVAIVRKPEETESSRAASTPLAARESAVLAREQAMDLREQAADRRDKIADQRDDRGRRGCHRANVLESRA